jgi:tetratricopeptide (TPR) repeat protein
MSAPPSRYHCDARPATRDARRRWTQPGLSLALLLAALLACAPESSAAKSSATDEATAAAKPNVTAKKLAAARARTARRSINAAQQLIAEGRLEHALSWTQRGLDAEPNDAELLRLHAEVLERLGRPEQGAPFRARANALAPAPSALPSAPLPFANEKLIVILMPPHAPGEAPHRYPASWPTGVIADALLDRLALRLPSARVELLREGNPGTLNAARELIEKHAAASAISLRVDRAVCERIPGTRSFAMAWIRWALIGSAPASDSASAPRRTGTLRKVIDYPPWRNDCRTQVVERAFEDVLALPVVAAALAEPDGPTPVRASWTAADLRALFPVLERRRQEALTLGLRALSAGDLVRAQVAFESMLAMDPGDRDALDYLQEMEIALDLANQLDASRRERLTERTGIDATTGERKARAATTSTNVALRMAESQLAREERVRRELLAAVEILDTDREAPTPDTLRVLRPVEIRNASATGPRLAREQRPNAQISTPGGSTAPAGAATISARALFAPGGQVVTRYYFATGAESPLLREDDSNGDGEPNRWISYEAGTRREVWERRQGSDTAETTNAHWVYAPGGRVLERFELDSSGNGRPDRVFRYDDGLLAHDDWDTSGDGRFDRFDLYGRDGQLDWRAEDLDGDGKIDVRTQYRGGRIQRREILDTAAAR